MPLGGRLRVGPRGCRSQENHETEAKGMGKKEHKEADGSQGCSFDSIELLGDVCSSILSCIIRGRLHGELCRPLPHLSRSCSTLLLLCIFGSKDESKDKRSTQRRDNRGHCQRSSLKRATHLIKKKNRNKTANGKHEKRGAVTTDIDGKYEIVTSNLMPKDRTALM